MFVHLVPAQLQSPTGRSPQVGWEVVGVQWASWWLETWLGSLWTWALRMGRCGDAMMHVFSFLWSSVCSPPLLGHVECCLSGPVAAVGVCGLGGRTLGSPQTGAEGRPGEAAAECVLL